MNNDLNIEVTVTAEADGTFFVNVADRPFLRWPTRERAEKSAAHVRHYRDAEAAIRKPSTTIKPPNPMQTGARAPRVDKFTWLEMLKDARNVFAIADSASFGLVCATKDRAWFQVTGDATPYSIAIKADEAAMFIFQKAAA